MTQAPPRPRIILGVSVVALAAALAFIVFIALLAGSAACSESNGEAQSVTGVVIDVEERSLTQTEAFTLRSDAGEDVVFRVAPDLAPDQIGWFVPGHLRSILTTGEEVIVHYRDDGNLRLAERMEHPNTEGLP